MATMLNLLTTQALAAFTLALLGGLHCAGMLAALSERCRSTGRRRAGRAAGCGLSRRPHHQLHAGRRAGRHAGRGAIRRRCSAGADRVAGCRLADAAGIGASLFGRAAWLKQLEPIGLGLWRLIGPLARRVYPPRSGGQALLAGLAWAGFRAGWCTPRCRWHWSRRTATGRRGHAGVRARHPAEHAGRGCRCDEVRRRPAGRVRWRPCRCGSSPSPVRSSSCSAFPAWHTPPASPARVIRPSTRSPRSATTDRRRLAVAAPVSFTGFTSRCGSSAPFGCHEKRRNPRQVPEVL